MPRFRFGLARLLRVREIHEELARSELMVALQAQRQAELALDGARADLRAAEEQLGRTQARRAVVPGEVLAAQRTLPPLKLRIAQRRARLEELSGLAEAARLAWQERRIDVRALEGLRERRRVEFEHERAKAENAERDEWVLARAERRPGPVPSDDGQAALRAEQPARASQRASTPQEPAR